MKPRKGKTIQPRSNIRRCAIYTRKSSEEGLEQAFNSLDAQREACEAYIRSQRHEGWVVLPTFYDDGGISGGTMERPALQQLLADIQAGKVDLVVVYKVDRLTRSLADFAKIVDVFDAHNASFVSVTQQFNTTTSMGRLTLNMLLSFAQFEREVTGERIRDKIAASKRKGMWMGGSVPLGYDVQDRRLVINEAEAETIRHIFRAYLELGSVRLLQEHLAETGIRSKLRPTSKSSKMRGGSHFERGALYLILQNRLYLGEITHKEASYPGEHAAIIDQTTWDAVQRRLADNRQEEQSGQRAHAPSLLAGMVYDDKGERLVPTHAIKKGCRYRYYISKTLNRGEADSGSGMRIPARELENLVWSQVQSLFTDQTELLARLRPIVPDGLQQRDMLTAAASIAIEWTSLTIHERKSTLMRLVDRIVVYPHQVEVRLAPHALSVALGAQPAEPSNPYADPITLTAPLKLKRVGYEMRLLIDGPAGRAEPNLPLIKLIVRAQQLRTQMMQEDLGIGELAERNNLSGSYLVRLVRLAFLAPDIIAAILAGRQPIAFTANTLLLNSKLPLSWAEQRTVFGFA